MIELNLVDPGNRRIGEDALVEVNMGVPDLEPANIPFEAPSVAQSYELEVGFEQLEIGAVSMGNPHCITRVADVSEAAVASLGPLIENHPRFSQRCNAGFLQVLSRREVNLRVFERGVGRSLLYG